MISEIDRAVENYKKIFEKQFNSDWRNFLQFPDDFEFVNVQKIIFAAFAKCSFMTGRTIFHNADINKLFSEVERNNFFEKINLKNYWLFFNSPYFAEYPKVYSIDAETVLIINYHYGFDVKFEIFSFKKETANELYEYMKELINV